MSKTLPVKYRGHRFWAFDVVSRILLKHMIDAATSPARRGVEAPWLIEAVARWRVGAVISDLGFFLDETWSVAQIAVVVDVIDAACQVLEKRDGIPAAEIQGWSILDDMRIFARGIPIVPVKPIIELGSGVIAILNGTLPKAPPGTSWFYGTEDHPGTIRMRDSNG